MGQRKSVVKKLGDTKMVIVLNRGLLFTGYIWTTGMDDNLRGGVARDG